MAEYTVKTSCSYVSAVDYTEHDCDFELILVEFRYCYLLKKITHYYFSVTIAAISVLFEYLLNIRLFRIVGRERGGDMHYPLFIFETWFC